jgi:hypothetical protein
MCLGSAGLPPCYSPRKSLASLDSPDAHYQGPRTRLHITLLTENLQAFCSELEGPETQELAHYIVHMAVAAYLQSAGRRGKSLESAVEGKLNESSLCFLLDCPFPTTAFLGWLGGFGGGFPHQLPYSSSDELFGYIVKDRQGFRPHTVDTRVVGLLHIVISGIELPKISEVFVNLFQCEISLTTALEMAHNGPLEPLRAKTLSNTIV